LYSLVIYDDRESLTVGEQTVTVPLFYAVSSAISFLQRLEQPWKTDPEDGAELCVFESSLADSKPAATCRHQSEEHQLQREEDGNWASTGSENSVVLEPTPTSGQILMGWVFGEADGANFTITIDYQGADQPYQMPPELARNRTDQPFFHSDAELTSLLTAVENWLVPQAAEFRPHIFLRPIDRFKADSVQIPDDPDIHRRLAAIQAEYGFEAVDGEFYPLWLKTYREATFHYRTAAAGTQMMLTSDGRGHKQPGLLYRSESFLALAWIEILWALDHHVFAQQCKTCGSVFRLQGPYRRSSYQCSPTCRRLHRLERMGGREQQRAYNRERKRQSRARQRQQQD